MSSRTRMAVETIAAALDAAALRRPSRLAVVSASPDDLMRSATASSPGSGGGGGAASEPPSPPSSFSRYTYGDFRDRTHRLAGFLRTYGYERKDVLVSDLPNVAENLMLQVACNRLGVTYAAAKNLEGMAKLSKVRGSVSAAGTGFLAETNLPLPPLSGEFLLDLIHGGGANGDSGIEFKFEDSDQDGGDDEDEKAVPPPHAYYNNTTPFTNQEALEMGEEAARQVEMGEDDVACVAITLCHAFGMGSAVCSALQRGAALVLPAVGGIRGCGVPSERAAATLRALESERCTLLFADTHTMRALPDEDSIGPGRLDALRGGVCKVGSGSQFLEGTVKYSGAALKTIGSLPK